MSIENPRQSPKFEQAGSEPFNEELALDKLQEFTDKILVLLENNPKYNADTKWSNLIYGLGATMGVEDVDEVLKQKGWNKNEFPREILASLPERPEVIYLLTPEQFRDLSVGTKLVDIFGDEVVVGDTDLKKEKTKNSYLPFGFKEQDKPEGMRLREHKMDYELIAEMKRIARLRLGEA